MSRNLFSENDRVTVVEGTYEGCHGTVTHVTRHGGPNGNVKKPTDPPHPSDYFTYFVIIDGNKQKTFYEETDLEELANSIRFITED